MFLAQNDPSLAEALKLVGSLTLTACLCAIIYGFLTEQIVTGRMHRRREDELLEALRLWQERAWEGAKIAEHAAGVTERAVDTARKMSSEKSP